MAQQIDLATQVKGFLAMENIPGAFSFAGNYISGNAYRLGDVVMYGNSTFVSLTGFNLAAPTNTQAWGLIGGMAGNVFRFTGAWQANTTLDAGDVVVQGGVVYASLSPQVTGEAFSTSGLVQVTLTTVTGPQGPQGPPINFRGAYSSGTTYNLGDTVSYSDGSSYISLAGSNTGNAPPASSQWALLAQKGTAGASATTSANGANGDFAVVGNLTSASANGVLVAKSGLNSSGTPTGIDPTGATDSTAGLQALFDAAGQTVEIPAGTYLIGSTASLILPSNKTIRGQGRKVTTLKPAGGIRVPITNWSLDTSVTPAILTVNLASTPFSGQFWGSNYFSYAAAFSITSSSVATNVATISYKLYAGTPPVSGISGQTLEIGKMAGGIPNGSYTITAATSSTSGGVTTGTISFNCTHANYTSFAENGYGAVQTNYDSTGVIAGLYYTCGSLNTGYANPYVFDGIPNFGTFQVNDGGIALPFFPATNGNIESTANSFKVAVSVPSGAATSGTGGSWVITVPAITSFDHRVYPGTNATNVTVRDLAIIGDCSPTTPKQGYSCYPISFNPGGFTQNNTSPYVNAKFLHVDIANLSGRAAFWIQGTDFLFEDIRFLNMSSVDFGGMAFSNVIIRDIVSQNTGWSGAGNFSGSNFSAAVQLDGSYGGKNFLIENYVFTPAVGLSTYCAPYAFGVGGGYGSYNNTSANSLSNVVIRNCTLDVTGIVTSTLYGGSYLGEFFTGGAINLTIENNVCIGWPLVCEVLGNNLKVKNNRGMTFTFSFLQATYFGPQVSIIEVTGNSATVPSNLTYDSGDGIALCTFSGAIEPAGSPYYVGSPIFDRIIFKDNHLTIIWSTTGTTPSDFKACLCSFGDGESGNGSLFLNTLVRDNTLTFFGTRPNTTYYDSTFIIDIPQTGSSGFVFSGNRTINGASNVRHLVVNTGTILPLLKIDGDETSNPTQLLFDNSGGTLAAPEMRNIRLGTSVSTSNLIAVTGPIKVGASGTTVLVDANGNVILPTMTPTSGTAGVNGQMCSDANYIYTYQGGWKKSAITSV